METSTSNNSHPFLQGGGEMGELTRNYDWSRTALGTPDQWPLSLKTTLGIVLHSAFPMLLFWGDELICFYNDAFRPSLGMDGKHPAQGQQGQEMWAEIWDFMGPLISQVMTTGQPVYFEDHLVPFYRNNRVEDIYWTFSYSPAYGDNGLINGVFVTCTETTGSVIARKELEEAQQQVLALFEQSPIGIAILSKDNLTFRMANPFYGELTGRSPETLIGKPLLEALPELQGQGFDQLLNQVIATGSPYIANEVAAHVVRHDQLETIYINLTYQPQREADGSISGILVVCTEVTKQVLARRKVEEAESNLRVAIELAELGTWQMDLTTGELEHSPRLRAWHGLDLDEIISRERAYRLVRPSDWQAVRAAMVQAIAPGSDGIFDVEYRVAVEPTGQERILHSQGKALFNEQGQAYKINGTVQDVTEQRHIQLALEQLVQQRTEELAAANEELAANNDALAANNEEYAAINEELEEANSHLIRSNDNLQQFAYVASHDLQEPLRKIQQFGDLLKTRFLVSTSEELVYVERMQSAASRMSSLIRDLLNYSRISTQRDTSAPVSLTSVVNTVLSELELRIQESGASITVDPLPVIQGDGSQLEQLFQNLLSNALKFCQPTQKPLIQIRSYLVESTELPTSVKPTYMSQHYYQIDVVDNGVGFDEKYLDRIFQVFQRLHSKQEFAGTGIGLAICKRVAANHGGDITASSQPGHGATFSIYLPVRLS